MGIVAGQIFKYNNLELKVIAEITSKNLGRYVEEASKDLNSNTAEGLRKVKIGNYRCVCTTTRSIYYIDIVDIQL